MTVTQTAAKRDRAPRESAQPERRCIASGALRPKEELLRFVAGPDGVVVPDIGGRLPGRGLWLSPERDLVQMACAKNLFAKAARAPLRTPDDLVGQTERLLTRRCLDLLGLAKRTGEAVAGYEKVSFWLGAGKASLLLQAADAAEGGRKKIRGAARRNGPGPAVVGLFTMAELGQALGRGPSAHVAVAPGGLAARIMRETARLTALRQTPPGAGIDRE